MASKADLSLSNNNWERGVSANIHSRTLVERGPSLTSYRPKGILVISLINESTLFFRVLYPEA